MAKRKQTIRGRFYEIEEGISYPSVTNILDAVGKPALIHWAAKEERKSVLECSANLYEDCPTNPKMSRMAWISTLEHRLGEEKQHEKLLRKAGEIGTQCHQMIEWTLRAKLCQTLPSPPQMTEKAMWAFSVFERWAKRVKLTPILVEQTVYSRVHGYAGTMDLLAEVEGVLTLVDFKTGKSVYSEAHLQNAAYRTALREMGHGDAKQGIIVRLPKNEVDPEPEAVTCDDEHESLQIFLNVKRLWEWMQAKDKWLKAQEEKETAA